MPNTPQDYAPFTPLEDDALIGRLVDVIEPIRFFAPSIGIDWNNIRFSHSMLLEVIDMIERRRVYFWIYHKTDMGELNEACLMCFWFMKFNLFYDVENPNRKVNLAISIDLFLRAIRYTAVKRGKNPHITLDNYKHLLHAFTYRDLSKESLMAIAESLIG